MYPYRVFISYSHEDKVRARKIVEALGRLKLRAMWDEDIHPGTAFSEAIQWKIARSHVFLPLITPNALERPWVHQETGYARALHVPVLPVAIASVPGQMIQDLQALKVASQLADLEERLREVNWDLLVTRAQETATSVFECRDHSEQRAVLLSEAAKRIFLEMREAVRVHQSGAMTSFCLPSEPVYHQVWEDREESTAQRSEFARELKRQERIWFERHAREGGCDLIVDPYHSHGRLEDKARITRLTTLRNFLESMEDSKVRVVVRQRQTPENMVVLGDWFIAQSVAVKPNEGYRQTIATWHAPTVLWYLQRFEYEFDTFYYEQRKRLGKQSSRQGAIEAILKQDPASQPSANRRATQRTSQRK